MAQRKLAMSTGDTLSKTIVASDNGPMAGNSIPAPAKAEKPTTSPAAGLLSLLQSDFFDLSRQGLRVAIVARNDRLYATIEFPEHVIDFQDGYIILDGKNVVTGEAQP